MTEVENLEIVIDVIDNFEKELDTLLFKLGEVKIAMDAVDDKTLDVDVDDAEVDALAAKLAVLQSSTLSNLNIGTNRGGSGTGGGGATSAAANASDGLLEMDLRMTDVHNALARLVPLLLTLIGAIPALYGAFIALAGAAAAATAALAALGGFAALGFGIQQGGIDNIGQGIQDAFSEIRDEFLEAFRPLAERLAPLFEDALDGLGRFFQAVADQGDALMQLTDDARNLGEFIMNTVPSFLGEMALFVDAMGEAFAVLTNMAAEIDVFGGLAGFIAEVLPPLTTFVTMIGNLLPVLLQVSIGFLEATNGVLTVINAIATLTSLLPVSNEQFGLLVGGILAASSAVMILNSSLLGSLVSSLISVGSRMMWLITANNGLAASFIKAKLGLDSLTTSMISFGSAVRFALAATGIGILLPIIGSLASGFLSTSTNIDKATESLKNFQQQQRRMSGGANPYREPDISPSDNLGTSRFAGSDMTINVEGDADAETIRNQGNNMLYRGGRTIDNGR